MRLRGSAVMFDANIRFWQRGRVRLTQRSLTGSTVSFVVVFVFLPSPSSPSHSSCFALDLLLSSPGLFSLSVLNINAGVCSGILTVCIHRRPAGLICLMPLCVCVVYELLVNIPPFRWCLDADGVSGRLR